MDITDISKVASRKRMNTDAEKLREKVSRETAKIIKLKVAQDTAYWDLKEKLMQTEGAHERLQQNMVDVQMQHEAASAHYQRELRLRPDTLNKVQGTRDICDVLEEYGGRLRRSVARCRSDRAALGAAYAACGARVRRLAERGAAQRAAARPAARRHAADARRLAGALEQLGAARARGDELAAARRDLAERLERATHDAQRRDEAALAIREDLSRLVREFDVQTSEMKRTIARLENELQAAEGTREQAARLARELEDARRLGATAEDARLRARADLAEAKNKIDFMESELTAHVETIQKMESVIIDKSQNEKNMEGELSCMKQYLCKVEAEKLEATEHLNKAVEECRSKASTIDEMAHATKLLEQKIKDMEASFTQQRNENLKKIEELSSAGVAKDRELDANTGTIGRLMTDLKSETDARARADANLAAARRLADAERDAAQARERALADSVARLDAAAKAKDDELSAQMTIIIDMRGEKERLQEKIQGMQNTIDNIQTELTSRLSALKGGASEPAEPAEQDAGLYNFLSDGSVDGDALDPREVGRRFEALSRGSSRGAALLALRPGGAAQVKDDMKIKNRTFFKNKRYESKLKKLK